MYRPVNCPGRNETSRISSFSYSREAKVANDRIISHAYCRSRCRETSVDLVLKRRRIRLTAFLSYNRDSTSNLALHCSVRYSRDATSDLCRFIRVSTRVAANERFNAIHFFNDAEHREKDPNLPARDLNGSRRNDINDATITIITTLRIYTLLRDRK